MTVISLKRKYCENARKYLDAYIGNELLVETSQEVLRHLESCKACSEAMRARLQVKSRLQQAVKTQVVPTDLRTRIHLALLAEVSTSRSRPPRTRWFLAAAALLVTWLGGWGTLHLLQLARPSKLGAGLTLSEQSASILRIGIADHVHCVIDSRFDRRTMTLDEMTEKMGPEYAGLVPLLREKLPEDLVISSGHRCHTGGREFVHMILKRKDQTVSVIITKKDGLSLPENKRVNSVRAGSISLHQDRLNSLEVVGFESSGYLAFVVSALEHTENFRIAAVLAGPVSGFLNKL